LPLDPELLIDDSPLAGADRRSREPDGRLRSTDGPILGGYLAEWTWRAIFWVNVPVAMIALVLIVVAKPTTLHLAARMGYRGAALIAGGVALSVFGLQESAVWGWSNPGTGLCIAAGVIVLVGFYSLSVAPRHR
jgi:hypothetical protein